MGKFPEDSLNRLWWEEVSILFKLSDPLISHFKKIYLILSWKTLWSTQNFLMNLSQLTRRKKIILDQRIKNIAFFWILDQVFFNFWWAIAGQETIMLADQIEKLMDESNRKWRNILLCYGLLNLIHHNLIKRIVFSLIGKDLDDQLLIKRINLLNEDLLNLQNHFTGIQNIRVKLLQWGINRY